MTGFKKIDKQFLITEKFATIEKTIIVKIMFYSLSLPGLWFLESGDFLIQKGKDTLSTLTNNGVFNPQQYTDWQFGGGDHIDFHVL